MTALQPQREQRGDSLRAQMAAWWSRLDRGWKAAVLGLVIAAVELSLSLP